MIWDSHSQHLTQMLDIMKAHAGKMIHHRETSKDLLKASWGEERLTTAAVYETDTNYYNTSSCSKMKQKLKEWKEYNRFFST